jgi:hypothetical protein
MNAQLNVSLFFFSFRFPLLFAFLFLAPGVFGQDKNSGQRVSKTNNPSTVKLIAWKALDCDNTFNPDLLIDRITERHIQNKLTYLTVNFADNCCPEFDPKIQFTDNKLYLIPYEQKEIMEVCDCNCCFSLLFEISNLPSKYEVYFRGKKVEQSEDPYLVMEPSHQVNNGNVINRRNKYGFQEGKWITFYENGNVESIFEYPETELYGQREDIPVKLFYQSGAPKFSSNTDTTQTWFEDGELMKQFIESKRGDTTYYYRFSKYGNRKTETRSLERSYPTVFHSEYNPEYKAKGFGWDVIYKEEFYENGQPKFLHGKDTTFSWHRNGGLKSKQYENGGTAYDSVGRMTGKFFKWKTQGPSDWRDLDHRLYLTFNSHGTVSQVHYTRDEATKEGVAMGIDYYWKWNELGKLIESPKKWKEALPWKRFAEIKIPF